ncbi:hypothetical protein KAJ27_04685 [bacterium]|nr:hypothetical protein [bacterium]
MMYKKIGLIISLLLFSQLFGQSSGREYRRSGIHNANLVRTVFGNWGVIGQPAQKGPRGAWLYDTNGYIGDVSPIIGAEVSYYDSVTNKIIKFHSCVVSPVARPSTGSELSPSGKYWTFEPQNGYFNPLNEKIATSTDPSSWPSYWPDKENETEDPGWPGKWNGLFGKGVTNADQESYFVMDDNNDEEFNYAEYNNVLEPWKSDGRGVEFKPDSLNLARNGLGLEVKVRGLQWAQFLASDVIFWLYEVTNNSTTDYDKVAFGMLAGTYVGITGTDDSPQEYNDDYSFFDVQRDLTYTGDYPNNNRKNPKWQGPVGMVGYAFLESPGNPFDGIDNDGDNNAQSNPGSNMLFTAPLFEEINFDSILYGIGDYVVLIDENYQREIYEIKYIPDTVQTRGENIIIDGITPLIEGNVDEDDDINPNVYDGIDNDLDGLIDENYLVHYRQVRKDQKGVVLIDTLNPVAYIDYINGVGLDDPLIDERRNDGIDNDGDWDAENDDVGADGRAGTLDFGEMDGLPTAGEPNFDKTDVDESDQIGLTSFNYFTPANDYPMNIDELLWDWMKPGYFDVPSSIVNNEPIAGEDGDFIYGSGYFPLRAGQTERFSLALVYGNDIDDLLKNRETVQKIYNADYRFPQPPEKPTLTVVPGEGKVTLYWDRVAENSMDPVTKEYDFEGYKIYKATDADFNDVFSVTNLNGTVTGYKPLMQYDKKNDIEGIFYPSEILYQDAEGFSYNLGSNTGLRHSYVDTDVEDGRRYFYAVVAYDRGDAAEDIFPSENTKFISVQPDGSIITDINSAMVRPGDEAMAYEALNEINLLEHVSGNGSGSIRYEVVDESKLNGHNYRVIFADSHTDGIDNDNDWNALLDDIGSDGDVSIIDPDSSQSNGLPDLGEPNLDWKDLQEYSYTTSWYSVIDETGIDEILTIDTSYIYLGKQYIIENTMLISAANNSQSYLSLENFDIDTLRGKIRLKKDSGISADVFNINYQYYPVYKSLNIQGSPYASETYDSDIFDGIQLQFSNKWTVESIDSLSYWESEAGEYRWSLSTISKDLDRDEIMDLVGLRNPIKFEIRFTDNVAYETPMDLTQFQTRRLIDKPLKTNFYIYDLINSTKIPFFISTINATTYKADSLYTITPGAIIDMFTYNSDSSYQYTWIMTFSSSDLDSNVVYEYGEGDILHVETNIPFRQDDDFEFSTEVPIIEIEDNKELMSGIYVVPNPYVVANTMEAPLPPSITSGRGERRIEFRKVPHDAVVHIFNSLGTHIVSLEHDGSIHNGTIPWDMKSKENLDISFGVYFYIVESKEFGKKSGKLAIIK